MKNRVPFDNRAFDEEINRHIFMMEDAYSIEIFTDFDTSTSQYVVSVTDMLNPENSAHYKDKYPNEDLAKYDELQKGINVCIASVINVRLGKKPTISSSSEQEKFAISTILQNANAATCEPGTFELVPEYNGKIQYTIPTTYKITIDYNKMAEALYKAGYRKAESTDQ